MWTCIWLLVSKHKINHFLSDVDTFTRSLVSQCTLTEALHDEAHCVMCNRHSRLSIWLPPELAKKSSDWAHIGEFLFS